MPRLLIWKDRNLKLRLLYFRSSHSSMSTLSILEEHLQPCIVYIQCIWQTFPSKAYCYFKGALAVMYLSGTIIIPWGCLQWSSFLKDIVFLWNKHLQSSLFSKVLSQFTIPVADIKSMIPLVSGMNIKIAVIHFSHGTVIWQ